MSKRRGDSFKQRDLARTVRALDAAGAVDRYQLEIDGAKIRIIPRNGTDAGAAAEDNFFDLEAARLRKLKQGGST
jgi:hypothetical protein